MFHQLPTDYLYSLLSKLEVNELTPKVHTQCNFPFLLNWSCHLLGLRISTLLISSLLGARIMSEMKMKINCSTLFIFILIFILTLVRVKSETKSSLLPQSWLGILYLRFQKRPTTGSKVDNHKIVFRAFWSISRVHSSAGATGIKDRTRTKVKLRCFGSTPRRFTARRCAFPRNNASTQLRRSLSRVYVTPG